MAGRARPAKCLSRDPCVPGTWTVITLLAAGLTLTGWMRTQRVVAGAAPRTTTSIRIDVNHAGAAQLNVLPGVGPRLSERIAADRAVYGPFDTVDDLQRVPGVGPRIVDRVRPYVVAGNRQD